MEENKQYDEFGKYLAGESPSAPQGNVPEEISDIWAAAGNYFDVEAESTDVAWDDLKYRINTTQAPMQVSWIRRNAVAVAASVALLMAGSAGIWYLNQAGNKQELAQAIHEKTGNRETKTIHLEDGTVVILNANSELTVAADYGQISRKLSLSGQASFEVARNEKLPMTVEASGSETRVLGTGFDISAYAGEDVKIFVKHGKVQFGISTSNLHLTKGMSAAYNPVSKTTSKASIGEECSQWESGNWVFKGSSLKEIALQVKHRLGQTLVFDSKFENKQFTGKFSRQTSAVEIAKTLTEAMAVPVTVK